MPVSRQELIEALERTAGGDLAAFKAVYAATSVKLYGIIIRILGRAELADEVLQEVYVRVWQRAGDFDRTNSSPITWLAKPSSGWSRPTIPGPSTLSRARWP